MKSLSGEPLQKVRSAVYVAGWNNRQWAANKTYQRFLGTYRLDQNSGLYFSEGASAGKIARVASCFLLLPKPLQARAILFNLTVSFCEGITLAGNSSTFYADFRQTDPRFISPHVEIGSRSLKETHLLAHLTHELSHLFYRSAQGAARGAWREMLSQFVLSPGNQVELTDYVHGIYLDWLASKEEARRQDRPLDWLHVEHNFATYVEEAFCDTMSVLMLKSLGLEHPDALAATTVNLAERSQALTTIFAISLT